MTQLSNCYKTRLMQTLAVCALFFRYLIKRMSHDRVNVNAGYLAYITLLSLVPMLTVLLSVLATFPMFDEADDVLQDFVINNFVPASGEAVHQALLGFIENTGKMTAVGAGFLFVAALMLMSNIDKNLNYIWRVQEKRKAAFSFVMYALVLTLGPIFLGSSIAATSYIQSLKFLEYETITGAYNFFLGYLPFLFSLLGFIGLYLIVPNQKVHFRHALCGAGTAALLFEVSKKGFAFYITQFPSYQLIYGALAAIPILFVWVFLCWLIVLIGAEVTAALGEREHWSDNEEMIHSTAESKLKEKGNQISDSSNPTSQ